MVTGAHTSQARQDRACGSHNEASLACLVLSLILAGRAVHPLPGWQGEEWLGRCGHNLFTPHQPASLRCLPKWPWGNERPVAMHRCVHRPLDVSSLERSSRRMSRIHSLAELI
jgi:hypothetical protein